MVDFLPSWMQMPPLEYEEQRPRGYGQELMPSWQQMPPLPAGTDLSSANLAAPAAPLAAPPAGGNPLGGWTSFLNNIGSPNWALLQAGTTMLDPTAKLSDVSRAAMQGYALDQTQRRRLQQEAALKQVLGQKGVSPAMQSLAASAPEFATQAILGSMLKGQMTALSVAQKEAYGLQPHLPWMIVDGKIGLPEGWASTKPEVTKQGEQPIVVDPYTGAGKPVTGLGAPAPKFEDVSSLRKEVGALDEVKAYSKAQPAYSSMIKSAGTPTSVADLDFVYGLAKIFDPDSVVREGEQVIIRRTQNLPNEVQGWLQHVAGTGGRLTPETRQRLLDVAQNRMGELHSSMETRTAPYLDIAKNARIDPSLIMPGVQPLPQRERFELPQATPQPIRPQGAGAQQPTQAQPAPRTLPKLIPNKTEWGGKLYLGGDPNDPKNWRPIGPQSQLPMMGPGDA